MTSLPSIAVLVAGLMLTGPGMAGDARCDPAGWNGRWITTYGPVWLTARGGTVEGRYEARDGRIEGKLDETGCILTGGWRETPSRPEFVGDGPIEFTLAADARFWNGRWAYADEPNLVGDWDGMKLFPRWE